MRITIMASIRKRLTKDGKTYFTVQIRLKGHPPQTATFDRITDAKKWAASTESVVKEGILKRQKLRNTPLLIYLLDTVQKCYQAITTKSSKTGEQS
jgi:hypothetical protein